MTTQLQSLDDILAYIVSSPPLSTLNDKLAAVAKKEYGEAVLASVLHGGQDPLAALDPARNTVGYLYILSARVNQPIGVPQALLANFCRSFEPAEAQIAGDRMHLLAKGLVRQDNVQLALPFLLDLTLRFASPGMLTTLHATFLHACVATRTFALALPVLSVPITEVSTKISPLTYHDNLLYHYAGGMALTALKRFSEAAEFFEIAASAPVHSTPAAIQFEALKKLTIVQLLLHGTTKPLPKYAHSALGRLLKNSPYHAFIKAYPDNVTMMLQVVDKEQKMFAHDGNVGLLHQAIARAPRWSIRKLTKTYLTLSLAEMGRAVGVHGEHEVRGMVISMIEQGEIHATVSAEGTVTFLDPNPEFSAKQVEDILKNAQLQGAALKIIDSDVGRSREFLTKAMKERDSGGGGGPGWAESEDLYASQSMWEDNF